MLLMLECGKVQPTFLQMPDRPSEEYPLRLLSEFGAGTLQTHGRILQRSSLVLNSSISENHRLILTEIDDSTQTREFGT